MVSVVEVEVYSTRTSIISILDYFLRMVELHQCICWAQSMDLRNPRIALRGALCATMSAQSAIHSVQSTDLRAIYELARAYCGSA